MIKVVAISSCLALLSLFASAREKLPIPRFVSIKSNEANIRTGPNIRYPIKWVFVNKNEPVEVVAEFEQWRKVKDFSGEEGWIHESMLSGKRFVITNSKEKVVLYKNQDNKIPLVVIEPKVRGKLVECAFDFCKVEFNGKTSTYKGWTVKNNLWGIYKNELYK